jgi:hypothetical protein
MTSVGNRCGNRNRPLSKLGVDTCLIRHEATCGGSNFRSISVFIVFAIFFLKEKLAWNYLVASAFLGVAAFFAFAFKAPGSVIFSVRRWQTNVVRWAAKCPLPDREFALAEDRSWPMTLTGSSRPSSYGLALSCSALIMRAMPDSRAASSRV